MTENHAENRALCIIHVMPHVSPAKLASEFLLTPAKMNFNPHLAGWRVLI